MRLRCLTISNFKSIKEPIDIEFDDSGYPVTLIGLNGSGKSNVLEAIYYVNYGFLVSGIGVSFPNPMITFAEWRFQDGTYLNTDCLIEPNWPFSHSTQLVRLNSPQSHFGTEIPGQFLIKIEKFGSKEGNSNGGN